MDQRRFDHLTRGLASGITRRGLVGNLTGAAIGGILVAVGASEAGAKRRKKKKRGGGKRKRRQSQCTTCSDTCTGAAENAPTKSLTFTPAGSDFCSVSVNLTGFAGCTEYTAEYWSAISPSGNRPTNNGNVTLGPTDLSGSSQTNLGTFVKGGYLDIRFLGGAPDFQWEVAC